MLAPSICGPHPPCARPRPLGAPGSLLGPGAQGPRSHGPARPSPGVTPPRPPTGRPRTAQSPDGPTRPEASPLRRTEAKSPILSREMTRNPPTPSTASGQSLQPPRPHRVAGDVGRAQAGSPASDRGSLEALPAVARGVPRPAPPRGPPAPRARGAGNRRGASGSSPGSCGEPFRTAKALRVSHEPPYLSPRGRPPQGPRSHGGRRRRRKEGPPPGREVGAADSKRLPPTSERRQRWRTSSPGAPDCPPPPRSPEPPPPQAPPGWETRGPRPSLLDVQTPDRGPRYRLGSNRSV